MLVTMVEINTIICIAVILIAEVCTRQLNNVGMHTTVTGFTVWLHFDANRRTVLLFDLYNPR